VKAESNKESGEEGVVNRVWRGGTFKFNWEKSVGQPIELDNIFNRNYMLVELLPMEPFDDKMIIITFLFEPKMFRV